MRTHFGAKATKEDLKRYKESIHWDGSKFVNLMETTMDFSFQTLPKFMYKQFCSKEGRVPEGKLDIIPFDLHKFLKPSSKTKFIWYGHSVVLLRMKGKTLLIDPMFGSDAAPIAPFGVKRFSDNTLKIIDQLPEIDLVLLTHDHYDHLDYDSISNLKSKVKHFFVALGVARHLLKWGVPANMITEFDWWQSKHFDDLSISFTPSRHFSGRGLTDRAKSLWGGWVFKSNEENIWFSGDGGYSHHFKEIGDRLGPFDFGFIECGQYNENWRQIHMHPEESVQAGIDAGVKCMMPVHWAAFTLAQHTWVDPVERFVEECDRRKIAHVTPQLGELIDLSIQHENSYWWKK